MAVLETHRRNTTHGENICAHVPRKLSYFGKDSVLHPSSRQTFNHALSGLKLQWISNHASISLCDATTHPGLKSEVV